MARGVSLRRAPRREKPNPVPGWGQLRTATRSCPGARTLGKAHVAHPRENPPPQAFIRIRDGSKGHRLGPGDSPAGTLLLEGVARPDAHPPALSTASRMRGSSLGGVVTPLATEPPTPGRRCLLLSFKTTQLVGNSSSCRVTSAPQGTLGDVCGHFWLSQTWRRGSWCGHLVGRGQGCSQRV